ncbi:putative ribonuclease H-like domain-containing protein [Tanacetum coccineum]|uniref:Ribonuclease H-like domain-containing protein n=1 Tax=Tanacetum coccineum TaxID=301880 RepID=A0ABQ4XZ50_9ASTR
MKRSDGNNTNNVNIAGIEVNAASSNTSIELLNDPNMPELEGIVYSDDYEDVWCVADMNNLNTFMPVSPIPSTRIHKDHPVEQIIRDLNSAPQTRRMTKNLEEHEEPNKVYKNKNDERGIVIKNKERLVAQGYTQEEGINYDQVFDPIARIEAIVYFLAYASFKDFMVYQMDVKSAFLYEKELYGLHQAPKAWYETLSTYLLDNGFHRGKINKTLFYQKGQSYIPVSSSFWSTAKAKTVNGEVQLQALGRHNDDLMFDTCVLNNEEVFAGQDMVEKEVSTTDPITTAGEVVTTANVESARPKTKGVVMQEPSESITTTTTIPSKDKGKCIMVEEPLKMKKKDQISFNEQEAIRLQAEFDEEVRLAREKDEANVALIKEWNDIQVNIKADQLLAKRLQAREQEELTIEERAKLFQQLLEKRRKFFAAKRAEEKRNKPPTKAQQRNLFEKAIKRVNTFVDMDTELVEGSETREEESSKRAGDELEQENAKKQKVDDDQETAELQQCDWKIIKERKIGAIYQIIRANGEIQRVSAAGTKVTTVGVES